MTDARIVPMTRAHIDAVQQYEQQMFGAEAWSAESYRDELADRRHRRYLAVLDGADALLGWGGVRVIGESAEILTIGIVPAAQGHGLGRRLLAALLAGAVERGAGEIFLEVRVDNTPARRLYEAEGFVPVGLRRGYYEGGRVDAVVMRRTLA